MKIILKNPAKVIPDISENKKMLVVCQDFTNNIDFTNTIKALSYLIKYEGKYCLRGSIDNSRIATWSEDYGNGQTIIDTIISFWNSPVLRYSKKCIFILENKKDVKLITKMFGKSFPNVIGEFQEVFNGNNRLQSR